MSSASALRGINFRLVLKALRTASALPRASTVQTAQQKLALTPAQRCGALLIAHKHDKSVSSASGLYKDVNIVSAATKHDDGSGDALDLGLAALLVMKQKATDAETKGKILRAMFKTAKNTTQADSLATALDCIESALKEDIVLSEADAQALCDFISTVAKNQPQHLGQRALNLLSKVQGSVPVTEEFLNTVLDVLSVDPSASDIALSRLDINASSSPLSTQTALRLVERATRDVPSSTLNLARFFPALDDRTTIQRLSQLLIGSASPEARTNVLGSLMASGSLPLSALRALLELNDASLSNAIMDALTVNAHTIARVYGADETQAMQLVFQLMDLASANPDSFKRIIDLASAFPSFKADILIEWCERNTHSSWADTRVVAISHVLNAFGLDGTESQMHRFQALLRGCESSFSPLLVDTWKQFYRWTTLEGIIGLAAEQSQGTARSLTSLTKAMRTCLKSEATSGPVHSHHIKVILDFLRRSSGVLPPSEAVALLEDLLSLSSFPALHTDDVLEAVLEIADRNVKNVAVTELILNLVARMLDSSSTNKVTLGEDSKSGVAPRIIATVIRILEHCHEIRQKATVQELQKDEWTDYGVFSSAEKVLSKIPCAREVLLPERTELSRAKRLLLFGPRPPASGGDEVVHNVKIYIAEMAQRDLLRDEENHPLALLAHVVRTAFPGFAHFGANVHPVVTTQQCFDDLLVPEDHVSRKPTDTFYLNKQLLLRPHTSAHQTQFLRHGFTKFLVSGDVYRRDEIDKTHFPVFHQMEGVKVLSVGATTDDAFEDLQDHLNYLADILFPKMPRKWIDAYFPFTDPSLELEIEFRNKSVELLGCGVVHKDIMKNCGLEGRVAWAFGLGLERLAMLLFQIPDIRLFWSTDPRFLGQFEGAKTKFMKNRNSVRFKSFSKFPPTKRDISFWLPRGTTNFHINDFFSIVREVAGDNVEEVSQVDHFHGPDGRKSVAFRVIFRSDFKTLSGVEVNAMMADIIAKLEAQFHVKVR